jgi:hypothetical protein
MLGGFYDFLMGAVIDERVWRGREKAGYEGMRWFDLLRSEELGYNSGLAIES